MRKFIVLSIVLIATVTVAGLAISDPLAEKRAGKGLPSLLKVDMEVAAQVEGDIYVITVNPVRNARTEFFNVIEVDDDYIVIEDRSGIAKRWIPAASIREVVVRKAGTPNRLAPKPFKAGPVE
jgi:hypothetical protein